MSELPRLFSREQAAAYCGLSPTQFSIEVQAGTFPQAFPLARTRRVLWDRIAIDRAIDARSGLVTPTEPADDFEARRDRWHQRAEQRRKKADKE